MAKTVTISESRKADDKARSASLNSRIPIEVSLDPLVTISTEGKITDVNNANLILPQSQVVLAATPWFCRCKIVTLIRASSGSVKVIR
ncbi:MAG: hypothetical protein ABSA75_00995 [Candidatus Bathyarchaeia archaeon]